MQTLVLDERDIPSAQWTEARIALVELTYALGRLPVSAHPFVGLTPARKTDTEKAIQNSYCA
jgi:hypothetical protein